MPRPLRDHPAILSRTLWSRNHPPTPPKENEPMNIRAIPHNVNRAAAPDSATESPSVTGA